MLRLRRCRWRRRRDERRALEERLRRYGESFTAPEDAKRTGLERMRAEFEHGRDTEA